MVNSSGTNLALQISQPQPFCSGSKSPKSHCCSKPHSLTLHRHKLWLFLKTFISNLNCKQTQSILSNQFFKVFYLILLNLIKYTSIGWTSPKQNFCYWDFFSFPILVVFFDQSHGTAQKHKQVWQSTPCEAAILHTVMPSAWDASGISCL